jgi:hypothetical protein
MQVSQSTYCRILNQARSNIADALIHGKAIKFKGGTVIMPGQNGTGPAGTGRGRSGGRGMGLGRGSGAAGAGFGGPKTCKCPQCGHEVTHTRGTPCAKLKCPKCNTAMVRGDIA